MPKQRIILDVNITLEAPIITQTSGAIGFGVDIAMQRDARGRPCIAGSLIKGNLRHIWNHPDVKKHLVSSSELNHWLGAEPGKDEKEKLDGTNNGSYEPQRGALIFSSLWIDKNWTDRESEKRFRIAIDEATGTTKEGALQIIDSPYATGEKITFSGKIETYTGDEELNNLIIALDKGLRMVSAFGAYKGQGFGRLIDVDIKKNTLSAGKIVDAKPIDPDNVRIGLRITLHSPICFAKPAIGKNNHFESEEHIPGGALIAAIANRFNAVDKERWPTLKENLSKLCFTHAKMVDEGKSNRAIAIPTTIVKQGNKFVNIVGLSLDEIVLAGTAPEFSIDWKYKDEMEVSARLNPVINYGNVKKNLNIRTAIENQLSHSEEGKLFSTETILPEGYQWLANVDFSDIKEPEKRKKTHAELQELLTEAPLTHLGKTKASASVTLEDGAFPYGLDEEDKNICQQTGDTVVLYLQSPARLLPTGFTCDGTNDSEKLRSTYKEVWQELSDESLELDDFYASQMMLGGRYWWGRFRKPYLQNSEAYHPEIFTQAGSVFMFKVTDHVKAKQHIMEWQNKGLPQLAKAPGGENWMQNPWIRNNGYGEIAINLTISNALALEGKS